MKIHKPKKSLGLKTQFEFARAKKALGQNFLINPKVAERIALEADISKEDTVLEIGPGTGKLTEHLLKRAKKVIAVEKDKNLFENLQEKFDKQIKSGLLVLVYGDILDSNNLLPGLKNYKIVANIPYNITGAIFKKFLSGKNQPKSMTLMVQKEVAERIMSQPRHGGASAKESLLSISIKAYGEPKILFRVSRGSFYPAPNVDSAVISINNISREVFEKNKINEDMFWKIVKAGFAHKRKKLSGNLKNIVFGQKTSLKELGNKRAEDLTIPDWIGLTSNAVKNLEKE